MSDTRHTWRQRYMQQSDELSKVYAENRRLSSEVERLRGQWIPVGERLPDNQALAMTTDCGIQILFFDTSRTRHVWTDGWDNVFTVTHWRELPAPPAPTAEGEPT